MTSEQQGEKSASDLLLMELVNCEGVQSVSPCHVLSLLSALCSR